MLKVIKILCDKEEENSLEDTVQEAVSQINKKEYDTLLLKHGIPKERIYKYGFAFEGKRVLIGK